MTHGKSIELLKCIEYFVQKPLLVMISSRRLLYGETSRTHCSGVILAHSSTVSSNLDRLWVSIWTLIFNSYFLLDSSQVIGWAILAALFSFSKTNRLFSWLCLGTLSCAEMFTLDSSTSSWYFRCWDWTN